MLQGMTSHKLIQGLCGVWRALLVCFLQEDMKNGREGEGNLKELGSKYQNTLHTCVKLQSINETHFLRLLSQGQRCTPEA